MKGGKESGYGMILVNIRMTTLIDMCGVTGAAI
jgi:hypothetical protein